MMKMKIYHFDGCGGCQLAIMGMQHDMLQLFELAQLITDNHKNEHVDIGLVIGHYTEGMIKNILGCCDKLLIIGACAHQSYTAIHETLGIEEERLYFVKGCPLSVDELVHVIHCIINGVRPKEKNYPVCVSCKENENICLLLKGMPCKGPITQAGCHAKCIGKGVPCRGCRGLLKDARLDVYETIKKNVSEGMKG